jgi:hypothetical protein
VRISAHVPYEPVFTFVLPRELDLASNLETKVE